MNNISYRYDKEKKALIATITDVLVIDDIILHYKMLRLDETLPRKLKVIIRGKDFLFNVKGPEIKKVSKYVIAALEKFKSLKEAIVVENSYSTAIGVVFEESNKYDKYQFKVFSSENSAEEWLMK